MVIDTLFLIASLAFGFGLSLATYRVFALRNGWPMGEVQADAPLIAVLLGSVGVMVAALFGLARSDIGGWLIPIAGLLVALVWTGVLRVGSQMSLFLAPLFTVVLMLGWAHINLPGTDRDLVPSRTFYERPKTSGLAPAVGTRAEGHRWAPPVIRDARDRAEVLPAPPLGLPRPIDPARVGDQTLLFRPWPTGALAK